MENYIRHLHCRYRVLGDRGSIGSVSRRLERVARQELRQAYEEALERRLGSDPAVVVLRDVSSRLFLPLDETPTDIQLARRWGERLAVSVLRRISEAGPGDAELIRFENQADYVSRFLADLLEGQAWGRWYYAAFRHLRGMPLSEALSTVLLDNRDHLGGILVLLSRRGILGKLIQQVDAATLRSVWFSGLRDRPRFLSDIRTQSSIDALGLLKALVASGRLGWPERLDDKFLQELDQALSELPWLDGAGTKSLLIEHFSAGDPEPATDSIRREDKTRPRSGEASGKLSLAGGADDQSVPVEHLSAGDPEQASGTIGNVDKDHPGSGQAISAPPRLDGAGVKSVPIEHFSADDLKRASGTIQDADGDHPGSGEASREPLRPEPGDAGSASSNRFTGGVSDQKSGAGANTDKDRTLFDQACRLIDELDLWTDSRRSRDALFALYRPRVVTDWRDTRALTGAVSDILAFLHEAEQLCSFDGPLPTWLPSRLEQVLTSYDWLDTLRLRTRLMELLSGRGLDQRRRPVPTLTPRQQTLLEALHNVIETAVWNRKRFKTVEAWALQVYAELVERYPYWSDDSLALRLIEGLAYARAALTTPSVRHKVLRALRRGDVDQALAVLPEGSTTGAREGLSLLTAMGPAALSLLNEGAGAADGETGPVDTRCAGVFLLLRAISDLKLPLLAESLSYPPGESVERPTALIVPLLLRLAGAGGVDEGLIDPGLALLLPGNTRNLSGLRDAWSRVQPGAHRRFLTALFNMLAGHRLVVDDSLHIHAVRSEEDRTALVGGDGRGLLWPFGTVLEDSGRCGHELVQWLETWTQALGSKPKTLFMDESLAGCIETGLSDEVKLVSVSQVEENGNEVEDDDPLMAHHADRRLLLSTLSVLNAGKLGVPETDLSLALLAIMVLRAWARWLPRFSESAVPYLLDNLIHRSGTLFFDANTILVELEPAPLDVVIEMAGYTGELEKVDWLGGRNVKFRIRR